MSRLEDFLVRVHDYKKLTKWLPIEKQIQRLHNSVSIAYGFVIIFCCEIKNDKKPPT